MRAGLVGAVRLRAAFAVAALAWVLMIVAAPLIASRAHASAAASALAIAVYAAGSLLCHQLPQRSFRLWDAQLPVCARCAGIYVAAAATAAIVLVRRGESTAGAVRSPDRSFGANRAAVSIALAAAPTAATLLYEWTSGVTPGNWIRFTAGVPLGACAAWLLGRTEESGKLGDRARDRR